MPLRGGAICADRALEFPILVLGVAPCNGSVNQPFEVLMDGTIKSRTAGALCVDIPYLGRAPQNHDALQLYQCHGGLNQKFIVRQ